mgnify:CR=1 FL=1
MKQLKVKIGNIERVVSVVSSKEKKSVLTPSEIEMDVRAETAVRVAIKKAKVCNKPLAVYDSSLKTVSLQ